MRRRRVKRERAGARLVEVEVLSGRVPPALDGVRIGHLSDLHVRTGVRPRRLEAAVATLNALRPDLVALTGDYLCLSTRPLPRLTRALRALEVPVLATLGNHDHWAGARAVVRALEAASVRVLVNASVEVDVRGAPLSVVGLDDAVTGHHDPDRAFQGVGPGAIVLSHDPKSARLLGAHRPALVLSGHTHGGQVYLRRVTPFLAARVGLPFLAGLFDVDGAHLYVSRGLGAALPVRFNAPPEVTVLTLRAAALGSSRAA